MADLTALLAAYAANIRYEDLPVEVVSSLKRLLLDTLGTTLAGNTLGAGCQEVLEVARGSGGSHEGTLIGFGEKVPAVMAALANGAMGHSLNYDATGGDGGHLGVTAVAAPLAIAERIGGIKGQEFLAGMAAGAELTARLAASIARAKEGDSHTKTLDGQVLGYFGAAASAGRVIKLTAGEMHNALAVALMQAAGTMQVVLDGDPPAKAIYGAFPNHAGVLSVLLSKQGLGAQCRVFEGEAGLFEMYYGGRYFRPALETELGEKFYLLGARFKPWPTSGVLHPFIEAALELFKRNVAIANIERVHITGGPYIRPFCEPRKERQRPQNPAQAANSVYFAVAKALSNGKVTLTDFMPTGLMQQEVLGLAQRIDYSIDESLGRSAIVEVKTQTGEQYQSRVDNPRGHSSKPLTDSQLIEKFLDCAQYAARPIPKQSLEEVIELVMNLESLSDMGLLSHYL